MTDKPRIQALSSGIMLGDGLTNVVANLGTDRDKAAHSYYVGTTTPPHQLMAAYRTSWLAAAIVDNPPEDETRNWRFWRADKDQITKIERLERKLDLKNSVMRARVSARLFGGAAIYMNTGGRDQASPLAPGREEIRSLVVLSCLVLRPKEIIKDIDDPYYGKAKIYTLQGSDGKQVEIHASRLVVFLGKQLPGEQSALATDQNGWGDSILESTLTVVTQYDSAMANMSSLLYESNVDVVRFAGFAELLQDERNDALVARRMRTMATMKGINGMLAIDKEDEYDRKGATFSGIPELIMKIQESAAGGANQPVTRIFGRAIAGLSGSGDGDERVYFDSIKQAQENDIGPALSICDECIIFQAIGSRPEEIYYEWAPLRQSTAAERADVFSKTASGLRALAGTQVGEIIPIDALSDAAVNEFTEQGILPGLDQAIEKYGTLAEQILPPDNLPSSTAFGDAEPRSLYVSRKVTNAAAILKHYASQGLTGLVDASKMHVTITYSSKPVDWMAMGQAWNSRLTVEAGGPRLTEAFGQQKDTAVLAFLSSDLKWRHDDMVENGASWDWPDYQPHITIAYDYTGDIESIEPWTGEIQLGPEIFETINENWKDE